MRPKAWFTLGLIALALLLFPVESKAGDGLASLQTAEPSCPDESGNIYVDCGNGTVTDNRTGLVWLQNADCLGTVDWYTAMEVVAGLSDLQGSDPDDCGLSDGSSPGEWRLPSIDEWEAMIADAVALGCVLGMFGGPSITNDSGTGCWQEGPGNSFSGVVSAALSAIYWSSTTFANTTSFAGSVALFNGAAANFSKAGDAFVWPVRGGQ